MHTVFSASKHLLENFLLSLSLSRTLLPPVFNGLLNINENTTKTLPLDNKEEMCKCHFSQGRNGDLTMSEFFRMASIAEYEPNVPPTGENADRHSSLLVRDLVTFDDFSAAMLLGANFRTHSIVSVDFVNAAQCSKSSENVGPALQLSQSPQLRLSSALTQSRDESVTPSWAEGVANHATNRI